MTMFEIFFQPAKLHINILIYKIFGMKYREGFIKYL